jgi:hypothetical protein
MKRITVLTLAFAVAAIVPTFALATTVANDRAHHRSPQASEPRYDLGPGEIPYLSQGIGVNEENFRGSVSATPTQPRVEIPYLSHGVGVTSAEIYGVAADDRSFSRVTTEPAPVVVTKDDGWTVDFGNPALAGAALILGLLAGGMVVGIWSRREKLSPA